MTQNLCPKWPPCQRRASGAHIYDVAKWGRWRRILGQHVDATWYTSLIPLWTAANEWQIKTIRSNWMAVATDSPKHMPNTRLPNTWKNATEPIRKPSKHSWAVLWIATLIKCAFSLEIAEMQQVFPRFLRKNWEYSQFGSRSESLKCEWFVALWAEVRYFSTMEIGLSYSSAYGAGMATAVAFGGAATTTAFAGATAIATAAAAAASMGCGWASMCCSSCWQRLLFECVARSERAYFAAQRGGHPCGSRSVCSHLRRSVWATMGRFSSQAKAW